MIDKIRNAVIPLFEDTDTEKIASIKLLPIVLWAAFCGAIGGVAPFVIQTQRPLVVSLIASVAMLTLTFKFAFRKTIVK